jgi:hypothetical protein
MNTGQYFAQRGLVCAVLAEKHVYLAGPDLEVHSVQGEGAGEPLGDPLGP